VIAGDVLAYAAAAILAAWGLAHIAPTRSVADGFGPISTDSRRILVMEWVAEGFAHVFVAVLVVLLTALHGSGDAAVQLGYRVAAGFLLALGAWTAATGARTPVVWFKLCPLVMTSVAALLVVASFV
jgi:hypothetical protein